MAGLFASGRALDRGPVEMPTQQYSTDWKAGKSGMAQIHGMSFRAPKES
jgi:hypothetical protein